MQHKKKVLLLVETSRAFGRGILQGISRFMLEHNDWHVQLEDRGLLETAPAWLKTWHGSGIITRTSSLSFAKALSRLHVPIVELFGNGQQVVAEVQSDEERVAECAIAHFLDAGFTEIGFFAIGNIWWSQWRQEAFSRQASERGVRLHTFPLAGVGKRGFYPQWEQRFDAPMLRWLKSLPKPIAVWAVSDTLAVRLLDGCHRLQIAIPEEVAILGSTNDPVLCNVLTPPLSSIELNSVRIGYLAAERLARKMRKEPVAPPPVLIPPLGVITRQSTDIVAIHHPEIAAAVRYIRENGTLANTSVSGVADALAISRSTLQRHFKKLVGRTVEDEIIRTRIEHAKRLLLETNCSLAEIAAKVGWASSSYFVQVFRRECELTPQQYRHEALRSLK
ncbi:MAG: XylR family transcriptional regulator [Thermoguttaceae bacterium]